MLPMVRRNKTKDILKEKKNVTVTELSEKFKVTEETIRKDLKLLEQEGFLVKTYGGAFVQEGTLNDITVSIRKESYQENKILIAQQAIKLIDNGDSVFLDSSTTAYQIALALKNKRITVATNSLLICDCLSSANNVDLVMTGGILSRPHMSFIGKDAANTIGRYYFDKAFLSCRSVSLEHGITDSNDEIAEVRRLVLSRAHGVFLVVDHTKFNKTSFVNIGGLQQVSAIITDKPLEKKWKDHLDSKNIKVFVPE